MSPLEKKKLEVELINVEAARYNIELRIMEREEEISRLKDNIVIQEKKEKELRNQLGKI